MLNRASEHSRVWKHMNVFYRASGTVDEINCEACGSICDVTQEAEPFRDRFVCPHNDEQWHWETLAMVQELDDTCSPSLRAIIQQDIDDAIKENL